MFDHSHPVAPPTPNNRYSGTSADLFKTAFDLMVSFKLFLGRFDMRTMQVRVACSSQARGAAHAAAVSPCKASMFWVLGFALVQEV